MKAILSAARFVSAYWLAVLCVVVAIISISPILALVGVGIGVTYYIKAKS